MTALIVFCGSFNPVTKAHISIIDKAIDFINNLTHDDGNLLETGTYRVLISPVHDSYPWKKLAPAKNRIRMLELAIEDSRYQDLIEINTYEALIQQSFTPTYDVLCHLKEGYPDKNMYFLCGADLVESMTNTAVWPAPSIEKIFHICKLLVAPRNLGTGSIETCELFRKILEHPVLHHAKENAQLFFLPDVSLDCSSSDVRAYCADNSSTFSGFGLPDETDIAMKKLARYVPFSIMAYIKKHHLYEAHYS
ncbi:Nicotinamide-nucleotide adenylyltransferase [Giardia lamblia P15]|uniref:Nicotinamide-nucleotide adenylyltransferase n=1 Tax=Giardia intestinalis (strain P15) TaxID=658858 RepID=E1F704_GIAIA|nr:Nicotinamide-nucleotide adenylyltransferase [Giardia lamblia P15]